MAFYDNYSYLLAGTSSLLVVGKFDANYLHWRCWKRLQQKAFVVRLYNNVTCYQTEVTMDNLDTVWHQLSPFRPVFSFIPSFSYSFLACLCLSPLAWSENVEDISDFSLNYNCILVILYGEFLTLECPICKLTNYPTNISPTLPKNRLTNSTWISYVFLSRHTKS